MPFILHGISYFLPTHHPQNIPALYVGVPILPTALAAASAAIDQPLLVTLRNALMLWKWGLFKELM